MDKAQPDDLAALVAPERKAEPDPRGFTVKDFGESAQVVSVSDRIRTVDQAFAHGGYDPAIWYVHYSECTSYECCIKNAEKRPEIVSLWRINLDVRRRVSRSVEVGAEEILRRMADHAPQYPPLGPIEPQQDGHLLEIGLYDVHFGKLAWRMETGQDYDLRIAEEVYLAAGRRLVACAAGYPISRILLPIGNDFFHVDNLESKTTRGTPQDADGRYGKMFSTGAMACVRLIEELVQIAPVDIIHVPGNHDRVASYHLAMFLHAWFRNCDRVSVDVVRTLTGRKYYPFGPVVLGLTHGDGGKLSDLPATMLHEARELMATRRTLEIHTGHRHKAAEWVYKNTDTYAGGVRLRILPSLSATDAWHHDSQYVGAMRAAEAYLWSEKHGYVGHFSANVEAEAAA